MWASRRRRRTDRTADRGNIRKRRKRFTGQIKQSDIKPVETSRTDRTTREIKIFSLFSWRVVKESISHAYYGTKDTDK
jgi:hypothetical protein